MAGEIKLNDVSVATEDAGTVTVGNSNVTFDANTVTTNLAFAANHAGIKTALNASGNPGIYACRAWVNFNGTGTVAIRASGNVSSLIDHTAGDYTVNFATAMPDANYSAIGMSLDLAYGAVTYIDGTPSSYTASSFRVLVRSNYTATPGLGDPAIVAIAVFR